MITIPKNSLILSNKNIADISYETIQKTINCFDEENSYYVDNLFYDAIISRLKLGNTCVVNCDKNKYNILEELVSKYGINYFTTEKDVKATKINQIKFHEPLNFSNGFMVIGDVHGCLNELKAAFDWAYGLKLPVILLGDLISYGNNTLETLEYCYDKVINNNALYIRGNHEIRLLKYFWNIISYSDLNNGNKVTVNSYKLLSEFSKRKWLFKLESLWNQGSYSIHLDNFHMAHGCIPKTYWNKMPSTNNDFMLGPWNNYSWIDSVPKNQFVIVGHNPKSFEAPVTNKNSLGGTTIFLDTGAGKGGKLSCVIIKDNKIDHFISF